MLCVRATVGVPAAVGVLNWYTRTSANVADPANLRAFTAAEAKGFFTAIIGHEGGHLAGNIPLLGRIGIRNCLQSATEGRALYIESTAYQGIRMNDPQGLLWNNSCLLVDRQQLENNGRLGIEQLRREAGLQMSEKRLLLLLILVAFTRSVWGQQQAPTVTRDVCSLLREPEKWAGRFVKVKPRLVRLKSGEWGIHDTCWPPILLSLPDEVKPPPDSALDPNSDNEALRRAKSERVSVVGSFERRIDWSGQLADSAKSARKLGAFGKAKLPVRMVLRRVSECTIIDLPYK